MLQYVEILRNFNISHGIAVISKKLLVDGASSPFRWL